MNIQDAISQLDWSREPQGLYAPIAYTLASGGKRVRPTLALMACRLFGGKEEEVMPAALALEMFHNFTLLHDDVMDKASVRRGRPTVHVRWNENTAILSGDQMVIEAYKLLSGVPVDKLSTCLSLFNKMATEICEGQQYDVDFEQLEEVTMEQYMDMIKLKTSVLLATALQMGAYIAGATDEQQKDLYQYGLHLGLAFQIQDDVLDCYGDPKTFGKAIGGDIAEGKKTFMWLTYRQQVKQHHQQPIQNKVLDEVLAEYDRYGVREIGEAKILQLTTTALSYLERLPQNAVTEQLRQLADHLVNRKS